MNLTRLATTIFFHCICAVLSGQKTFEVSGKVFEETNPLSGAVVKLLNTEFKTISDSAGKFSLKNVPEGSYELQLTFLGYHTYLEKIKVNNKDYDISIKMTQKIEQLSEVEVRGNKSKGLNGLARLNTVENLNIYAGKKNDIISPEQIGGNLALNNSREIFSKIAGLNVWENDGSGIQLNVSTRGLSPNRSWELNVRQDGVNIQADVMGYPDSYYTPTMDAVESIELVRGSGALQYGTQMGGLMNFKMKRSRGTGPFELEVKQGFGYGNMYNNYIGIGGTSGKVNYYMYYHHRSADAWRENSDYNTNTLYGFWEWQINDKFSVDLSFTHMKYLLHLAAGLTDAQFQENHRLSFRERNWFEVGWNVPTLHISYKFNENNELDINNFAIFASRNSVENTNPVNIPDDFGERDVRTDGYWNFGTEIKFRSSYSLVNDFKNHFTAGLRLYRGNTERLQGLGTNGSDADFSFINPDRLEYNDYNFVTENQAIYVENLFQLTDKLSITPGMRYEFINQTGDGYFNDGDNLVFENLRKKRNFALFGLGAEYSLSDSASLYSSITEGFRAVHFNDFRVENPNIQVDSDMRDSRGYNFDIGFRGLHKSLLNFDLSLFYLRYNDRVGVLEQTVDDITFLLRTNVADSRSLGLETFVEAKVSELFFGESDLEVSLFNSYSYINAKYINTPLFEEEKYVEFSPRHILRSGLRIDYKRFRMSMNSSWVSSQFSDANNTLQTVSGNNGKIPRYRVADWSCGYTVGSITAMLNINNVFNEKYFTRRASGYPGPGLIPSDPRGWSLGLTGRF